MSTDVLSVSQGDLLQNFIQLKALIDVNHATFGIADQGKHPFIQFPNVPVVAGATPAATGPTECALYSNNAAGAQNLYFRPAGQAAGVVANDIILGGTVGAGLVSIKLPNGLIFKWGKDHADGGQHFAFATPFPNGIYTMQVSTYHTTGAHRDINSFIDLNGYTAAGFDVYGAVRNDFEHHRDTEFTWLAIGY